MNLFRRIAHVLLNLWIGAVAATAIVAAPNVFGTIREKMAPLPLTTDEANRLSGDVMAPIFSSVDLFGIAAAALFVLAAWKQRPRAIAAAVIGLLAAANLFYLAPRIAARAEGFEAYHKSAEILWGVILLVGLVLAVLGPGTVLRAPPDPRN